MRVTRTARSVAMKAAPMVARVTDRLCCTSTRCSSAVRRLRTSDSRSPITDCRWLTDGMPRAAGIRRHSATAVATDSAAVMSLVITCSPQSGHHSVHTSITWVTPHEKMKAQNNPATAFSERLPRLRVRLAIANSIVKYEAAMAPSAPTIDQSSSGVELVAHDRPGEAFDAP